MNILSKCQEHSVPMWLWIIYSINSMTYAIILLVLSLAHIFQKKKNVMEFTYFLIGITLYWIASISGIIRYYTIIQSNNKNQCDEKTIGIILIICSFLMMFDVCMKIFMDNRQVYLIAELRPQEIELSER
ncbi:uncharacterized protein LOC118443059 [Vespa mandarinia]|uniref:uncharacterized protein LOC118443059 n=1 Tax=Vespa mandarinia TaxID=7446 RepID=UPI00161C35E9|nr:uncharacterized protein LOC118443059 [Vespa mandarinia]